MINVKIQYSSYLHGLGGDRWWDWRVTQRGAEVLVILHFLSFCGIVVIHILCECYKCFCKYLVYNIFIWMVLQKIIIFSEAYLWLIYSIIRRLRVFPVHSGNENQGRHKSEKIGRGVCKILLLLNQFFSVASHIFVDVFWVL